MKGNSRFIIYILIILACLISLGLAELQHSKESEGIYDAPGYCEYCNTKLEKTVIGDYPAADKVVWYCPNPDCEH